ncbi:DNA polymerase III subunit epsilon [Undibacterium sp. LX40W]|uniref:DNA polymerase III subunit epsilon n=1 Tax=Undibacterium nitidum TaxID=2762298 RepID=A0A923KN23_9BURK|nr:MULTISPECIES: DNA polymerase III subunit epsilon [Undibacterium]MBC3880173.1 DNA polymerase III subunit epsilon [Undibacterium nitidum]MBC3891091.1 DNA polymerase III subunit epsilon [Undibacterium sp. LX40W]
MSRQIVLDTETTGLNPRQGNRVIEIGCVELINRKLTGNNFHRYINPERESEEGALAVHGLTTEFLSDKPKFSEIVEEFLEYVQGAELVIHNAPFDMGFLNAEFELLGRGPFDQYVGTVIDSLVQAKELHPGKRNSLDALCDRYEISNAHRKLHGALLDAELLADVFLAMSRGQNSFISLDDEAEQQTQTVEEVIIDEANYDILILRASEAEIEIHQKQLEDIGKNGSSVWMQNKEIPV